MNASMTKGSVRIVAVVAVLALALAVAYHWRGQTRGAPPTASATSAEPEGAAGGATGDAAAAQELRPPSEPRSESPSAAAQTIERADDEVPDDPAPVEPDIRELVGGIDPLLGSSNLIVRAPDPATNGAKLMDLELKFRTESGDPAWSSGMESQILERVARIGDLRLVTLDAECRETICRVKLFHPPRTNALSSLEQLRPLAAELGFAGVAQAATIEEDVPVSLLYLQREEP
jgi:hypothetical protein